MPTVTDQVAAPPAKPPPHADQNLLALLLASTGEGIFGIDLDGCCSFINHAGARMLGLGVAAVLGRNMHQLTLHPRFSS